MTLPVPPPPDDDAPITPLNGHAVAVVDPNDPIILDKADPLANARFFVNRRYVHGEWRTIQHHQSVFQEWTGTHYREIQLEEMRADLYEFLESAHVPKKQKDETWINVPFKPTSRSVSDMLDAARGAVQLKGNPAQPSWLVPDSNLPDPREMIACRNGILHLPTGALFAHTPNFYNPVCLDYDYDPFAPEPTEWFNFLKAIWPNDIDARSTLQDIFGYLLGTDTDQQKIPLLVGPKRSGKGTIGRILTAMVGQDAVVSPTLASLENNFGVAPLIHKRIAMVSDARLGGRADQQVIAERLLSISGEDMQTVDRKHMAVWTGRLPTRFFIMTNELPRIADASGALASRFLVLTMQLSFYGKEDHGLTDRLLAELPGILNWAIEGWKTLRQRGYFLPPSSSVEAIRELEDLSSPVGAFIREHCDVGQGYSVPSDGLYLEWENWCRNQGRDHTGTKQTFGRDLRSAVPGLGISQLGPRGERVRTYEGIRLKKLYNSDKTSQENLDF